MKILGTTDSINTCEKCGKSNLKKTVALELTPDSEPVFWGADCASKAISGDAKKSSKDRILLIGDIKNTYNAFLAAGETVERALRLTAGKTGYRTEIIDGVPSFTVGDKTVSDFFAGRMITRKSPAWKAF